MAASTSLLSASSPAQSGFVFIARVVVIILVVIGLVVVRLIILVEPSLARERDRRGVVADPTRETPVAPVADITSLLPPGPTSPNDGPTHSFMSRHVMSFTYPKLNFGMKTRTFFDDDDDDDDERARHDERSVGRSVGGSTTRAKGDGRARPPRVDRGPRGSRGARRGTGTRAAGRDEGGVDVEGCASVVVVVVVVVVVDGAGARAER